MAALLESPTDPQTDDGIVQSFETSSKRVRVAPRSATHSELGGGVRSLTRVSAL